MTLIDWYVFILFYIHKCYIQTMRIFSISMCAMKWNCGLKCCYWPNIDFQFLSLIWESNRFFDKCNIHEFDMHIAQIWHILKSCHACQKCVQVEDHPNLSLFSSQLDIRISQVCDAMQYLSRLTFANCPILTGKGDQTCLVILTLCEVMSILNQWCHMTHTGERKHIPKQCF